LAVEVFWPLCAAAAFLLALPPSFLFSTSQIWSRDGHLSAVIISKLLHDRSIASFSSRYYPIVLFGATLRTYTPLHSSHLAIAYSE
jgi:hypothetical protein